MSQSIYSRDHRLGDLRFDGLERRNVSQALRRANDEFNDERPRLTLFGTELLGKSVTVLNREETERLVNEIKALPQERRTPLIRVVLRRMEAGDLKLNVLPLTSAFPNFKTEFESADKDR